MLVELLAILVVFVGISGIVCSILGYGEDAYRFNCRTEKWEYVPTKYDIMWDIILKSK